MRVLLDESMPRNFGRLLPGHQVRTVQEIGWASIDDRGMLPRAVEAGFAVLVTMDRGIPHQQRVDRSTLGVVVMLAPSNRLVDLAPLSLEVLAALRRVGPGQVVHVGFRPGSRP